MLGDIVTMDVIGHITSSFERLCTVFLRMCASTACTVWTSEQKMSTKCRQLFTVWTHAHVHTVFPALWKTRFGLSSYGLSVANLKRNTQASQVQIFGSKNSKGCLRSVCEQLCVCTLVFSENKMAASPVSAYMLDF